MFWTTWPPKHYQTSGLIERAEMDGSQKFSIITDNVINPLSITVDHVLKLIFWIDKELNVLESANFKGSDRWVLIVNCYFFSFTMFTILIYFNRRQIVSYDMFYASAMAVFENHVYWSDWGSDGIIKCEKFTGECSKIIEKNVKALDLLAVHKVMQPKG